MIVIVLDTFFFSFWNATMCWTQLSHRSLHICTVQISVHTKVTYLTYSGKDT
jgi:hypothetical protein